MHVMLASERVGKTYILNQIRIDMNPLILMDNITGIMIYGSVYSLVGPYRSDNLNSNAGEQFVSR